MTLPGVFGQDWRYLWTELEEGMDGEGNGTNSSTLAWKIPRVEEPGGLQSIGSLGVGHD